MGAVVIVPARGGSRRIPRKNVLPVAGIPVLTRTLMLIQQAAVADHIVVSTDDDEIAALAREQGVHVITRNPELADDHTPLLPVIQSTIRELTTLGIPSAPDRLIGMVFATAITMQPSDLRSGRDLVSADHLVVSVTSYAHPPQRGFVMGESGNLRSVDPASAAVRTQDLPAWFHDAAQFVWGSERTWMAATSIFENALGYHVPRWRAVDLDEPEDLQRAEVLLAGLASLSQENGF